MDSPLWRHKALAVMLDWAKHGLREVGSNNHGPMVDAITRADNLPGIGYSWCQSTCNAAWRLATGGTIQFAKGVFNIVGGNMLLGGTASVGLFLTNARRMGYVVVRPLRGDHVCYHKRPGDWPYHVGMLDKVLALGPVLVLRTVEGNTGYSGASVSDPGTGRDAVLVKRRVIRRSLVTFVRVPGR